MMAHIREIETTAGKRHQVRWNDPTGKQRSKLFVRSGDAKRFEAEIITSLARGTYVDSSPVSLATVAERWFASRRGITPATRAGYRTILDRHILPNLGRATLSRLGHDDVQQFIAELSDRAPPGTVPNVYFTLRKVLTYAVKSKKLGTNPALEVELPPQINREMLFLDAAQVEALADATRLPYRELVLFAAYTGLRAGEIVALRMKSLDLDATDGDGNPAPFVHVRESVTFVEKVGHVRGPTKTKQTRTVPLPGFLADLLRDYTANRLPEASVFTARSGQLLKHNSFYRSDFKPAVLASLPPELAGLRFHDLRHTTASLLIAQNANPKEVSTYLGHSTINITMDRYGHLYPNALAKLTTRLDAQRASVVELCAYREAQ
jgi:integrase